MELKDLHMLVAALEFLKKAQKSPQYPDDHKAAMKVPKGGSSCSNCKFLVGKDRCGNKYFQDWHGSDKIPAPIDEYCSDWFEPK